MSNYIFSGKIHCLDCGQKFRGKMERSKRTYICQGYMKKTTDCKRFSIDEKVLTDTVKSHFESDDVPIDQISSIEVANQSIRIVYSDNSESILSPRKYIV